MSKNFRIFTIVWSFSFYIYSMVMLATGTQLPWLHWPCAIAQIFLCVDLIDLYFDYVKYTKLTPYQNELIGQQKKTKTKTLFLPIGIGKSY